MKKQETIQSTMRLPKNLWKSINRVAVKEERSMQKTVIRALREYVAMAKGDK